LRFLKYPLHCQSVTEETLAILAAELGITVEQLISELERSCQAIEAEARLQQECGY
jgi:hypothetical protein